jgi:hypothetical protein
MALPFLRLLAQQYILPGSTIIPSPGKIPDLFEFQTRVRLTQGEAILTFSGW